MGRAPVTLAGAQKEEEEGCVRVNQIRGGYTNIWRDPTWWEMGGGTHTPQQSNTISLPSGGGVGGALYRVTFGSSHTQFFVFSSSLGLTPLFTNFVRKMRNLNLWNQTTSSGLFFFFSLYSRACPMMQGRNL